MFYDIFDFIYVICCLEHGWFGDFAAGFYYQLEVVEMCV